MVLGNTTNHGLVTGATGDSVDTWAIDITEPNWSLLDDTVPIVDTEANITDTVSGPYTIAQGQLAISYNTDTVYRGDASNVPQPIGSIADLEIQTGGGAVDTNPSYLNFGGAATITDSGTGLDIEVHDDEDWSVGGQLLGATNGAEAGPLALEYLSAGETLTIHKATLLTPDQQALPSGVEIGIYTGSAGTLTLQQVALTSDNATLANNSQESSVGLASYTAGTAGTVGIYLDNGQLNSTLVAQDMDFHTNGEYRITG